MVNVDCSATVPTSWNDYCHDEADVLTTTATAAASIANSTFDFCFN